MSVLSTKIQSSEKTTLEPNYSRIWALIPPTLVVINQVIGRIDWVYIIVLFSINIVLIINSAASYFLTDFFPFTINYNFSRVDPIYEKKPLVPSYSQISAFFTFLPFLWLMGND